MPWDAWVLISIITVSAVIVVGALIEDPRGTGTYVKEGYDGGGVPRPISIRIRGGRSLELRLAASAAGQHRRRS